MQEEKKNKKIKMDEDQVSKILKMVMSEINKQNEDVVVEKKKKQHEEKKKVEKKKMMMKPKLKDEEADEDTRRMPRNPQASRTADRFHVGDVAVWHPVRDQNKEERVDENSQRTQQDDATLPAKSTNSGQTNLKNKRAEMERYVPKPVEHKPFFSMAT